MRDGRQKNDILRALRYGPQCAQALAEWLGTTPAVVHTHVKTLRAAGYTIHTLGGRGRGPNAYTLG